MPLFGSRKETVPPPTTTTNTAPNRSSGFFSRRRSDSPSRHTTTTTSTHGHSPNRTSTKLSHGSGGGLLHRNHEDASITNARERVVRAEAAERDADRALIAAKGAVREAIADVRRLEHEAAEEVCTPAN
jgi:hypothetical protein